jgi:hypothetical protein
VDHLEVRKPDVRQEDPIHTEAARLGVPRENWDHPTVRAVLGEYASSRKQQEQYDRLSRTSFEDADSVFNETKKEADKHSWKEDLPPNPPLRDVFGMLAEVESAKMALLRGCLQGGPTDATYIQRKLNAVLPRYGMRAVNEPPEHPKVKLPPIE